MSARIIIIGPPASGKTTTAQNLGARLGIEVIDTDGVIVEKQRCSIAKIFAESGETSFRKLEQELLDELIIKFGPKSNGFVVSVGGGLPIFSNNFEKLMSLGKVVCLTAKITVLLERLKQDTSRPLLSIDQTVQAKARTEQIEHKLNKLLAERITIYSQAPYLVDTSNLNQSEVVSQILSKLGLKTPEHC